MKYKMKSVKNIAILNLWDYKKKIKIDEPREFIYIPVTDFQVKICEWVNGNSPPVEKSPTRKVFVFKIKPYDTIMKSKFFGFKKWKEFQYEHVMWKEI